MKLVVIIAAVLLVVGGINWGLVGLLRFDLVATLFGGVDAALSRVVYSLVGVSAVIVAVMLPRLAPKMSGAPRLA